MLIATHSGKFHADDVWAVTVLDIVFPGGDLIRTRVPERIDAADFAVDVGGVWAPASGRFDHHQKGFDAARPSGVVYASAGLVWKEHGPSCVARLAAESGHPLTADQTRQIAHAIDADLVQYLDMSDTGAARNAPGGYGLSAVLSGFNPSWVEEQGCATAEAADDLRLRQFRRAMDFVRDIVANAVRYRIGGMLAIERVRTAPRLEGGRVLYLDNGALPWSAVVRREMPNVLFVIGHHAADRRYTLHTVPAADESFEARRDLPAAWAGLQGDALARVTGVPDAVFCHNGRFIAAAQSYEGVLALARLALDEAPAH